MHNGMLGMPPLPPINASMNMSGDMRTMLQSIMVQVNSLKQKLEHQNK